MQTACLNRSKKQWYSRSPHAYSLEISFFCRVDAGVKEPLELETQVRRRIGKQEWYTA